MLDVAIIGCGVIGAASAYELSHYRLQAAVFEAENDVADCTTKANSAILHAGYDPEPGTRMARLNVEGSALAKEICARLDVPYRQCGSLVLALSPEELPHLQKRAQTCAMLKEKQGRRYAPCSLTTAKPVPRCSRRRALARRILQRKAAFVQVKPSSASASPARTGFCRLLLCTAHRMLPIFIVLMGFLLRKERIPSRAPFDMVLSISPDIFASNA